MSPTLLNPAAYNPQVMTPAEFEALKAGIRQFGFVENVVVQRESPQFGPMVIVGGHSRQRAIREICIEDNVAMPDIPCTVLDLTDRQAKKLNISLNRVHGSPNAQLLGELLEDIDREQRITADEVQLMGFEEDEFRDLLHLADPPAIGGDEESTFGQSVTVSLTFADTKMRDAVKNTLAERAKKQKQTTGEVVFGLLGRRAKAS